MEPSSFLGRPQKPLKLISWNTNGIKTKVKKLNVQNFLLDYDVICLNEIKTSLPVHFPGYIAYVSRCMGAEHRGGTCIFVRRWLSAYVTIVDLSISDQVWLRIDCVPNVLFGFCYIPPSDSPYFNLSLLSSIQEKVKSFGGIGGCILLGDFNARFGIGIRDVLTRNGLFQYSYPFVPDPIPSPNENAQVLLGLCIDEDLLIVNNLQTSEKYFQSALTYRQGQLWTSELDYCIISHEIMYIVDDFQIIQDRHLPSNHAPLSIKLLNPSIDVDYLTKRAAQ